jgi:hypothetical protein
MKFKYTSLYDLIYMLKMFFFSVSVLNLLFHFSNLWCPFWCLSQSSIWIYNVFAMVIFVFDGFRLEVVIRFVVFSAFCWPTYNLCIISIYYYKTNIDLLLIFFKTRHCRNNSKIQWRIVKRDKIDNPTAQFPAFTQALQ